MEATFDTLEQYSAGQTNGQTRKFGEISETLGNWVSGIFGCTHRQMSRPFSRHGDTYRVCIGCGAQRKFDADAWKSRGPYFYRAANTAELREIDCTALRSL